MLLKYITAVTLFTATGAALAGGGKPPPVCNIIMFLPAYDVCLGYCCNSMPHCCTGCASAPEPGARVTCAIASV